MKKVGIVTMSGNFNYGNRLQNYALQEAIKKHGYDVETIWNEDFRFLKVLKQKAVRFINYILSIFNIKNRRKIIARYKNFKKFTNTKINNSKYTMYVNYVPKKLGNSYDYFVVGSDQVWNYTLNEITAKNFLGFSKKAKNIAYAPSLGISKIEEDWHEFFKKNLDNIKSLSCREEAGAKEIERITGRTCPVVLDPTMLLSANEWDKVVEKPKYIPQKKYILLYFLGEFTPKYKEQIDKVSKENDFEIINILDIHDKSYTCGPSEFLYLIKNASLVCTDSFHACVFSIIYKTPFLVFERYQKEISSMNSRIDTLVKKFSLENRKFNGEITNELLECNFNVAHEKLELEKQKSYDYLKQSLK